MLVYFVHTTNKTEVKGIKSKFKYIYVIYVNSKWYNIRSRDNYLLLVHEYNS